MNGINLVIQAGNCVADPEVRPTGSGGMVANMRIAVTETYRTRDQGQGESTEYVRCILFGRLAEIAQQYVHKGDALFVRGRMQTRKYTDGQGVEKYITEVIVEKQTLLGQRHIQEPAASQPRTGVDYETHEPAATARPASRPNGNNHAAARGVNVENAFNSDNPDLDIPF